MMAIVNSESRFTLLDRQTGEGFVPKPKQTQEEKNRQWRETWRDGETEAGRAEGQAPEGESPEDRRREQGRQGGAQAPEEEVT